MNERIDQRLVQLGLARSRSQAQSLIQAGQVLLTRPAQAPEPALRSSLKIATDVELTLREAARVQPVSRGAFKLDAVIEAASPPIKGALCVDAGQSTGGFTERLLAHGAAHVIGLDVGHDQLAPALIADSRVSCFEKTNVRDCTRSNLAEKLRLNGATAQASTLQNAGADIVVADLSFISLRKVLAQLSALMADTGALLALVKPQFELGPGAVNKRGIVTDSARQNALRAVFEQTCQTLGLELSYWIDSPIAGGDGNREFLMAAHRAHNERKNL